MTGVEWIWAELGIPMADLVIEAAKSRASKALEGGAKNATRLVKVLWDEKKWFDAETRYREKLLSSIRVTKVLGNPTSNEIEKIYTDVFVFDKLSAIRRYNDSLDEDEFDVRARLDDRQRIEAKSVVEKGGDVFILGRPGAGKTTFLKYLAMRACKGLSTRTPIFVSLKDWGDTGKGLFDYLVGVFDICNFPEPKLFLEKILQDGKALILLDGLDEVNQWQDKRNRIIKDIVSFSTKYDKNQYCLTCRTASTDYSFESFEYVEVADFTDEQKLSFARQWYGKSSQLFERFEAAWTDGRNAGLRELGRTPLLLALLCLSFDESLSFPKRLVDLYQEAINALTKKWDNSRLIERDKFYKDLSYGQRQQLLESVAATFFFNSRTVFRGPEIAVEVHKFLARLPDVSGAQVLDAVDVVRQIEAQHGLIVERARNLYTFSHLTIQEYFTASFISKTHDSKLLRQIVKSALNDQKWREVMLYTVALLPDADAVLDEMVRQVVQMRQGNKDVSVFLVHSYAVACLENIEDSEVMSAEERRLSSLRTKIEIYTRKLQHPSLTVSELASFSEHVKTLLNFLHDRSAARKISLVVYQTVAAAAQFLKKDPLDAGKLLGGYFVRPEQFLNYFYACRLFIECLDVAITARREELVAQVFQFDAAEIDAVEKHIS